MYFLVVIAVTVLIYFIVRQRKPVPQMDMVAPEAVERILELNVVYYKRLNFTEKTRFRNEVMRFIQKVRITGVKTIVTDEDRVFVAASAIIPIFAFQGWQYSNLHETLLYPDTFDEQFDFSKSNPGRQVLGMVGSGAMNHVMILSQPSLRESFVNKTDKNNTAIHEFVHLIDQVDGSIDGIPEVLLDKACIKPWLQLIHEQISSIQGNKSDINPYGATNEAEFFAVAAEYFFERPLLLDQKHPELYALLENIFRQNPATDSKK